MNLVDQYRRMPNRQVGNMPLGLIAFLPSIVFSILLPVRGICTKLDSIWRYSIGLFKRQKHSLNAPRGHANTRIRGAIIQAHSVDIAAPLIGFFRSEDPLIASFETNFRVH